MASIMDYVKNVSDPASSAYVEKEDRIAVYDSDSTLYGGGYPYSDSWLCYDLTALFIFKKFTSAIGNIISTGKEANKNAY